jgi:hypothetical protein
MDNKTFEKIVKNRLEQCEETLNIKGNEYSNESDRLHNFKDAAKFLGCSPEKALLGMFVKHLVSVKDIIENINIWQDTGYIPDEKLIAEKFGDTINYILLLEALIEERRK